MFLSGLLPRPMTADDDRKLLQYGIGFTNIVERTTRGSANLTRKEIEDGKESPFSSNVSFFMYTLFSGTLTLTEKIRKYRPKIAVFNGKGIYEIFCNKKDFFFGKQPDKISGTDTVSYTHYLRSRQFKRFAHQGTEIVCSFKSKCKIFNGQWLRGLKYTHVAFKSRSSTITLTNSNIYLQHVWVMPNSSARCAQLPRAVDKVPFYSALKKFSDYLKGVNPNLNEQEVVFKDVKLQNFNEKPFKKDPRPPQQQHQQQQQLGPPPNGPLPPPQGSIPPLPSHPQGMPPGLGMKPEPGMEGGMPNPMGHPAMVPEGYHHHPAYGMPPGMGPMDPIMNPDTGKKKRGRPPKPKPDGPVVMPVKRRAVDENGTPVQRGSNPIDPLTGKKKRGRPKKPEGAPVSHHKNPKKSNGHKRASVDSQDSNYHHDSNQQHHSMPSQPQGPPPGAAPPPGPQPPSQQQGPGMPPLPPFSPNFGRPPNMEMMEGQQGQQQEGTRGPQPHHGQKQQQQPMHSGAEYDRSQQQPPNAGADQRRNCDYPQQPRPDQYPYPGYPGAGFPPPNANGGQAPGFQPNYTNGPAPPQPPPNRTGSQPYDGRGNPSTAPKTGVDDVASKSITGLESLVDQIPSIENDSGVYSGSGTGSHPTTPRSVGPYSPAAPPPSGPYSSPFPGFPPAPASTAPSTVNHFVPSTSDNSFPAPPAADNNSTSVSSGITTAPSNFSVSSLVTNAGNNSPAAAAAAPAATAPATATSSAATPSTSEASTSSSSLMPPPSFNDTFSVSSLTSSYAAAAAQAQVDMASKYASAAANPYMSGFGSSAFSSGFLGQPNSAFPSPMGAMAGMGAMGAYYGAQYSQAAQQAAQQAAYAGAGAAPAPPGFPAAYSHGLHMPNPGYPYSPYSQSPYSQSPYF